MNRIEEFYGKIGTMEKQYGDVYGLVEPYMDETDESDPWVWLILKYNPW